MTSAAATCSPTKTLLGKRDATVAALEKPGQTTWSDLGVDIEAWEAVLGNIMSEAFNLTEWDSVSLNQAQGWFKEDLAVYLTNETNEEVVVSAELLEEWLVDFNAMRASLCKWSDVLLDLKTRVTSDFEEANGKSANQRCAEMNLDELSNCAEKTFEDCVDRSYERAAKKWAPMFYKSAPCRVV